MKIRIVIKSMPDLFFIIETVMKENRNRQKINRVTLRQVTLWVNSLPMVGHTVEIEDNQPCFVRSGIFREHADWFHSVEYCLHISPEGVVSLGSVDLVSVS